MSGEKQETASAGDVSDNLIAELLLWHKKYVQAGKAKGHGWARRNFKVRDQRLSAAVKRYKESLGS